MADEKPDVRPLVDGFAAFRNPFIAHIEISDETMRAIVHDAMHGELRRMSTVRRVTQDADRKWIITLDKKPDWLIAQEAKAEQEKQP